MSYEEGMFERGEETGLDGHAATYHSPQSTFQPGSLSGHQGPVLPHPFHEAITSAEILSANRERLASPFSSTSMNFETGKPLGNEFPHLASDPTGSRSGAAGNVQDQGGFCSQKSLDNQDQPFQFNGPMYVFRGSPSPSPALEDMLARQDESAMYGYDDDSDSDVSAHYLPNVGVGGGIIHHSVNTFDLLPVSPPSPPLDPHGNPDFAAAQTTWQAQNGGPDLTGPSEEGEYEFSDLNNEFVSGEDVDPNLNFYKFAREWRFCYEAGAEGFPHISARAARCIPFRTPGLITKEHLAGEIGDIQGINWQYLETSRRKARRVRAALYHNWPNIERLPKSRWTEPIPNLESYFQFHSFDMTQRPCLTHFQLRHNLSASSSRDIFYTGASKVVRANYREGSSGCVMDFSKPDKDSVYPSATMRVSTLSATNGVLIAGGYCGEYVMKNLSSETSADCTEGVLTDHADGITNHVHTILDRSNSNPQAIFSSNDHFIRTLDCNTNKVVKEHKYSWPVNCAATSPDGRLRVVVGDTKSVMIDDADTGAHLVRLDGHHHHGFACAWADDGRTVATANQDMQIMVFDARWWQRPLAILWAEQAGVRSLHFSPVGGGKRVLLMAEPADIVSVVDADLFESKQNLDMFGEISGTSFSPDGTKFFVANTDSLVGGVAEYERVGYGEEYGIRHLHQREIEESGDDYIPEKEHDWVSDDQITCDKRVVQGITQRRRRGLGLDQTRL